MSSPKKRRVKNASTWLDKCLIKVKRMKKMAMLIIKEVSGLIKKKRKVDVLYIIMLGRISMTTDYT